jgi:CSLREA domain-containing protein
LSMETGLLRSLVLAATGVLLIALVTPVAPARAASIIVTSTADTTADDGNCTLREAVVNANDNAATWSDCEAGSGADTITFGLSGTIRLSSALPNIADLAGLTISGAGKSVVISGDTDGNGTADVPILIVDPYASLILQNLTITKGNAGSSYGGGIYNNQGIVTVTNSVFSGNQGLYGGAISNDNGAVTVSNSVFSGNQASGGGAISSGGPLTVTNSTFSSNSTNGIAGGGAIYIGHATLVVAFSTFSGNSAMGTGDGGGIENTAGTLTITYSTFASNSTAGSGGGIADYQGNSTIIDSTFFGNSAQSFGGGIWVYFNNGTTVTNSTFADNLASAGNSVYNNTGKATFRNSILASASVNGNCVGLVTNGGHNIDSSASCSWGSSDGSMSNTNPLLGPLANNGGPTQTIALQPGSPAIDAGNATICALLPPSGPGGVDQRGTAHKGICDIGAFEFGVKVSLPLILK